MHLEHLTPTVTIGSTTPYNMPCSFCFSHNAQPPMLTTFIPRLYITAQSVFVLGKLVICVEPVDNSLRKSIILGSLAT